jgi:elongation factor Ts
MAISVDLIKKLRQATDAPMGDCKKALEATNGDIEEAKDWLRKNGTIKAGKKADRETTEGLVGIINEGKNGYIFQVSCETDFVAKSEQFIKLMQDVGAIVKQNEGALETSKEACKGTIENGIAILGENVQFANCGQISVSKGVVSSYTHNAFAENVGKIGVLVGLESDFVDAEKLRQLGKQIAMHVAACSPLGLDEKSISPDVIEREKALVREQVLASGKPENIVEKMLEGRMQKFFGEITLLNQPFVMDNKITVSGLLEAFGKDNSTSVKITGFLLYKVA